MLYSLGTITYPFSIDTAPVDGTTLAGVAPRDSFLRDTLTEWLYRNEGTTASPVWRRYYQSSDLGRRVRHRDDFTGGENFYWIDIRLFDASGDLNKIPATTTARGGATVPRSGVVTHAEYVGEDALALDGTNYVTFTLVNKLGSGSGSTAVLAAGSGNNTTNNGTAGAVAIAAWKTYPLECNTVAVNSGDTLVATVTVSGTIVAMDCPVIRVRIQTLPTPWVPRVYRAAGSPTVVWNGGTTGLSTYTDGNAYLSLSSASEAQYAGMDWGYHLLFSGSARPIFEARLRIGTNPATNSKMYWGLTEVREISSWVGSTAYGEAQASRYAYDNSAIVRAVFKLSASMVLTLEGVNGSESFVDQDAGLTLASNTWYTFQIDARDLSAVRYLVDGKVVGTLVIPSMTGALVPNFWMEKASSANAPTMRVDYTDISWDRS